MNPPPLTTPLADLAAWTRCFAEAEIPVLADTARALDELRANEDAVDAHTLGGIINEDPLMTLKVLVHAAAHRPERLVTDVETVTAALVLMGITPFFEAFASQPTVEEALAAYPQALTGLRDVLRRSHRAANFVLGFSVHRMDPNAHVVQHAALLHDTAEMLLWCHAPTLALRIRSAQQLDSRLRSIVVQRELLNVELPALQRSLMKEWHLPAMFTHIAEGDPASHPGVRSIALAVRLARHTSLDWDNPALPDDVADIGALLNLSAAATWQLLTQLDS
jgi:hypothetical protein